MSAPVHRTPGRDGRIRQRDDSLTHIGINAGDIIIIDLTKQPENDELCAAFTAQGKLVVRYFYREKSGHVRLSSGLDGNPVQVFAPSAVLIFGRVREILPIVQAEQKAH